MVAIALVVLAALAVLWFIVIPVFERLASPRVMRVYWRLTMPFFRWVYGLMPSCGVVETVGRRSGRRHQVPVGGRKSGDTFWLVSGTGRRADYVRNMKIDPRVRVKIRGRWHTGTAHLVPEDDARRQAIRVSPMNGLFLVLANKDPLTIRIDLDKGDR